MKKTYLGIVTFLTILCSISTYGQKDYSALIQNYLESHQTTLKLSPDDFSNLKIYDQYHTKSMDLVHVYAIQKIHNIPVFNGIGNFAVKKGEVVYFANSFQSNLTGRTNGATPQLTPTQAVSQAAQQLGLPLGGTPEILSAKNTNEYLISKSGISQRAIPVKLVYQSVENESLRLAWDLSIQTLNGKHWWSVRVDAMTGEIIDKGDWTVSCTFSDHPYANPSTALTSSVQKTFGRASLSFLADGSQYKVFALPIESPNHGVRTTISEPADVSASPYGWHDTDGVAGPEYTITRGNNVWAFENRDGDDNTGPSPDGGTTLDFIFPLNLNQDPSGYIDASTTNLFYMNNMMHDIWFLYGFDEPSGNFQATNYSTFGNGNDFVLALAQDGAADGPDNNARFATPPDGTSGVMFMFTWSPGGAPQVLTINSPTNLAGNYTGTVASFGPGIPTAGITADFALVVDDNSGTSTDPNDGCDVITNGAALSGKIAIIRRGICQFDEKVLNAQNEGAIAAIIVNDEPGLITMSGDDTSITIPSIMIPMNIGNSIITSLSNGNTINGTIIENGPYQKDGSLDNGVMAHEYGHGISTRLTGGPANSGCLQNDEQMGEGWSDFFALVLTMEAGDLGTDARGMATYVLSQPITGGGLRAYPYSTDMSVNPFTYADVETQFNVRGSHGVGSVWATMLWDLTWALIEKHGFDPDVYNGTGGNNIAMQLVIDGLKLQPCSPGFINGRDAILQADMQNNNGANQCLIWEVFARRGLGWSADQGLSSVATDQTEAFDMPPASELDCSAGTQSFNGNSFQVYPNPTNGIVHIASSKINGTVQITLFDINGRKVLQKNVEMDGQASINVSELSTGIYVMQFVSKGKAQTKKLIVQ